MVDRTTPVPELELDQEEDLIVDGEDVEEDLEEDIPLLPLYPGPGEEKKEDWETKASPQSRKNQPILEEENDRHLQVDVLDPSIKNCDGK